MYGRGEKIGRVNITHNGELVLNYKLKLWTNTNEELINELKALNDDDYTVTGIGLFGKKNKFIVDDNKIDKYKNKKKDDDARFLENPVDRSSGNRTHRQDHRRWHQ